MSAKERNGMMYDHALIAARKCTYQLRDILIESASSVSLNAHCESAGVGNASQLTTYAGL